MSRTECQTPRSARNKASLPSCGARRGAGAAGCFRGAGDHRLGRLYGSGQLRDEYPGRGAIRLCAALGGAAGQSDRDAVSGAVGAAGDRDRQEPGRDIARQPAPAAGLGDVGRQRGRGHGHRPGRVSGRRHRPVLAVQPAADRRHGDYRDRDLWHSHLRDRAASARWS